MNKEVKEYPLFMLMNFLVLIFLPLPSWTRQKSIIKDCSRNLIIPSSIKIILMVIYLIIRCKQKTI